LRLLFEVGSGTVEGEGGDLATHPSSVEGDRSTMVAVSALFSASPVLSSVSGSSQSLVQSVRALRSRDDRPASLMLPLSQALFNTAALPFRFGTLSALPGSK